MSKRRAVHPIRRMQIAAQRCETEARERASLARSVKPLLDALKNYHDFFCDCTLEPPGDGSSCELLAAWRAKL